jgi:hypothetical protein
MTATRASAVNASDDMGIANRSPHVVCWEDVFGVLDPHLEQRITPLPLALYRPYGCYIGSWGMQERHNARGKAMTKTAVNDLRPCWRCDGITFWRARDGVVHCSQCSPPHPARPIAERLRDGAVLPRPVVAWSLFQSAAKSSASIARAALRRKRTPLDRGPQCSIRLFPPNSRDVPKEGMSRHRNCDHPQPAIIRSSQRQRLPYLKAPYFRHCEKGDPDAKVVRGVGCPRRRTQSKPRRLLADIGFLSTDSYDLSRQLQHRIGIGLVEPELAQPR